MGKTLLLLLSLFFFVNCSNTLYSNYILTKKYPQTIPTLELKILNDTTGIFKKQDDKSIEQYFEFIRIKKFFLVVTYIDDVNNLVFLEKGDTIFYYKKDLYIFNEKQKLFFNKTD